MTTTLAMTNHFPPPGATPRPAPRSRLRVKPPASESPENLPLRRHPMWPTFVIKFGDMLLNHAPAIRPHFLELLDQADLL